MSRCAKVSSQDKTKPPMVLQTREARRQVHTCRRIYRTTSEAGSPVYYLQITLQEELAREVMETTPKKGANEEEKDGEEE